MTWIEPLQMQTWFINVLSGDPNYFGAIAIFAISIMAGYFRMTILSMFLMMGIFMAMFSEYIGMDFLILFGLIGGLVTGYWVSKFIK